MKSKFKMYISIHDPNNRSGCFNRIYFIAEEHEAVSVNQVNFTHPSQNLAFLIFTTMCPDTWLRQKASLEVSFLNFCMFLYHHSNHTQNTADEA